MTTKTINALSFEKFIQTHGLEDSVEWALLAILEKNPLTEGAYCILLNVLGGGSLPMLRGLDLAEWVFAKTHTSPRAAKIAVLRWAVSNAATKAATVREWVSRKQILSYQMREEYLQAVLDVLLLNEEDSDE